MFILMKVAICFFGLTRSLQYTIASIKKNIFEPLSNNDIEYDVYLHTFKLTSLTNRRSSEINCKLNPAEYKLLEPIKELQIDDQNKIDKTLNFNAYRTKGDPWRDSYTSLNNLLRQLYSLEVVTRLWVTSNIEYDAVIYCRPDVKYLKPLSINWLHFSDQNTINIPSFLSCGGYNDRFAIGPPNSMQVYGNRRKFALEYSQKTTLHAERFLGNMLKSNNVKVIPIHFPFHRVRANGNIAALDIKHAV